MTKTEADPSRMWTAMVAKLHECYGCRRTLRNSAATVDAFCRACLDRSRPCDGDDLGGEC